MVRKTLKDPHTTMNAKYEKLPANGGNSAFGESL
jgi:hypothetical protein